MQRKSNILKFSRHGFAMIMAILVIIIISTILTLALSLTAQTSKSSVDLYIYEKANLLARAAGEYARLRIGQEAFCGYVGTNGVPIVEDTYYNITIDVNYAYDNSVAICNPADTHTATSQEMRFGAALIDITVEVNDATITSEPIRIFRRKLVEL